MFIKLTSEKGESRYLNANHIMQVRPWSDGKLSVTMTDHSITLNSDAECKQLLAWLENNSEGMTFATKHIDPVDFMPQPFDADTAEALRNILKNAAKAEAA